jgi:flagellar biogenesis protein FliO
VKEWVQEKYAEVSSSSPVGAIVGGLVGVCIIVGIVVWVIRKIKNGGANNGSPR